MTSESNLNKTVQDALDLIEKLKVPYNNSLDSNGLRTQANAFIRDAGVKASPTDKVSSKLIYWRYLKWCTFRGVKPMSKLRLMDGWGKFYKKYTKKTRFKTETGYYIESKNFNISKDEMEILWQYEERLKKAKLRNQDQKVRKKQQKDQIQQEKMDSLYRLIKE